MTALHPEQLAIAVPAQRPSPHRWVAGTPDAAISGVGRCGACPDGAGPLADIHRVPAPTGAHRFFQALADLDYAQPDDAVAVTRAVLRRGRDDLARLSVEHGTDERFRAGVAWGHALAGLALGALAGERDPAKLSFLALRRRATRRRRAS